MVQYTYSGVLILNGSNENQNLKLNFSMNGEKFVLQHLILYRIDINGHSLIQLHYIKFIRTQ